jgi:hypothetical protein
MTRVLVTVADVHGCAFCGVAEGEHGERSGLGHFGAGVPKRFVAPSELLLARRVRARQVDGRELGAFHPITGEPLTHLVVCKCRCGATALATPEQAGTARCSPCLQADVEQRHTAQKLGGAA